MSDIAPSFDDTPSKDGGPMTEVRFDDLIPPTRPPPSLFEAMWHQAQASVARFAPQVDVSRPVVPPAARQQPQSKLQSPSADFPEQAPSMQGSVAEVDRTRPPTDTAAPVTPESIMQQGDQAQPESAPDKDEVYFHDLIPTPAQVTEPAITTSNQTQDAAPSNPFPLSNDGGPPSVQPELRAYNPSIYDSVRYAMLDAFTNVGVRRLEAQHLAEGLTGLLNMFSLPASVTMALDDMQRAARRGDLAGTLIAAIGAIPGARLGKSVYRIGAPSSESARRAAQLAVNARQGKAFEASTNAKLLKTDSRVSPQVTVKTQTGARTRLDFLSEDPSGAIKCTECKASATAPVKPGQAAAHQDIAKSGGTVVGKGKPGFPGGTVLPPTNVDIIRP
jgi:hypothetical protein